MLTRPRLLACCAMTLIAMSGTPLLAQDEADGSAPAAPPPSEARTFEPAYFTQYAPRNALEMIRRLPGFAISGGNDQGQRGLGQATQNVIVNGKRLSSKSDSVEDQLARIPASDVVRIELVDGNTLDIPGLTGLVANVVANSSGLSGQFRWESGFRLHNTEARLYGGEVSLTGSSGRLDYTLALSNPNDRFGADGPVLITDAAGNLIERQDTKFSGKFDQPKLAGTLAYDSGGGVLANVNGNYSRQFFRRSNPEIARSADGLVRSRQSDTSEDGPQYEIGGDLQFPLGPGKLKLIGLERYERDDLEVTVIDRFDDGRADTGFRFAQTNGRGERIGRLEYGFSLWQAEWQIAAEAAFNRLDRSSALAELDDSGEFVALPFPGGTGGVREDRYEASVSFSRPLSPKLSIQAIAAVEFSTLEQTGAAPNSRQFQRPKGSFAATWKPSPGFDVSLTLARRVSQLSFGDFLASVSLDDDNANGGNNQLVPFQSWNVELEANKSLGPWGSVKFEARQAWFEDFIDWFPLADGGEARGNIGDARRLHFEVNATVKLDPLGWKGARLDIQGIKRYMSVVDPFTGLRRGFSYDQQGLVDIALRHDIPGSDWAWGAGLFHNDQMPYSRRFEVGREWEGPVFDTLLVEHKDVFGLTVEARVTNLLGARNKYRRVVYDGSRPDAPVEFAEQANRRIGPIFRFTVRGNF